MDQTILQSIDMDSYRVEKRAVASLRLADEEAEIEPPPVEGGGRKPEPELDPLSLILQRFTEQFGTTFSDADRILRHIRDDIAPKVAADAGFRNALQNTPHTARLAHDQALAKAAQGSVKDYTQFYKQFVENDDFKRFVGDMVFRLASARPPAPPSPA
jgi:type I restriction enzyme R subunit